jgi:hypothetical protein
MDKLLVVNKAYGVNRANSVMAAGNTVSGFSATLGEGSLALGSSNGVTLLNSVFVASSKVVTSLFTGAIGNNIKLYPFTGQKLENNPNFGHEIDPLHFEYRLQAAVAAVAKSSTYGVTSSVTLTDETKRYTLGLNFTFNDLRATGNKEIIDHRIEYRNSFYWDSSSDVTSELNRELLAFAKKIERQTEGLVTVSVNSSNVITVTGSENVTFSLVRDKITHTNLGVAPTPVTAFTYGVGTPEQILDLERRCSSTYGANPLGTARGNSLYTKESEVNMNTLYDTVIIKSYNASKNALFLNDNNGLIGTTYIAIDKTLNATVTAHLVAVLAAIKAYAVGAYGGNGI